MADQSEDFAGGTLLARCADGIGSLVIDVPERRNAISAAMWRALTEALDWLVDRAKARVIILSGAGAHFSAGADITEFDRVRSDAPSARTYDRLNADAFAALRHCPVPVIAAIRGVCYGGGLGLAAACDLRIGAGDARFAVPAAKLGLTYPIDAIADFIETLGAQTAKRLIYTGEPIDGQEALRLGFLMQICDADAVPGAAKALAAMIAGNAPLTVRASKQALRYAIGGEERDRTEALVLADRTFGSADYAEGRLAFREKRAARFIGR